MKKREVKAESKGLQQSTIVVPAQIASEEEEIEIEKKDGEVKGRRGRKLIETSKYVTESKKKI